MNFTNAKSFISVVVLLAASVSVLAASASTDAKQVDAKTAKVADFAFLIGTWEGTVGQAKVHQVCRFTDTDMMLCMFWVNGQGKGTEMIEIYTLRDTDTGVEERVKFFSPSLTEKANDEGVTMKLASYSPTVMVFENPNGTYPKRSTVTRNGETEFNSRVELVDAQGKQTFHVADWKKVE